MAVIISRRRRYQLINVFTVEPAKQQALVDLLTRATDETIRHLPGFVSANIHRSVDGERVTNYAQWRSREDLEAMLRNPAAMPGRIAIGAAAAGALALGACAIGALAIGRLAIGALALNRARVRRLSIDVVDIGRLGVCELVVDRSAT